MQHGDGTASVFLRRGDGDSQPLEKHVRAETGPPEPAPKRTVLANANGVIAIETLAGRGWRISTRSGTSLGDALAPPEFTENATLSSAEQSGEGRVFAALRSERIVRVELTGLDTIQRSQRPLLRVASPQER